MLHSSVIFPVEAARFTLMLVDRGVSDRRADLGVHSASLGLLKVLPQGDLLLRMNRCAQGEYARQRDDISCETHKEIPHLNLSCPPLGVNVVTKG